ncbi:hypothetical protein GLE_4185 [Lysobacter enzymogenes]|uniref:Uncharacterized protein n=1 Tax=Lysobacter enzymogenes TaxID=69 RepID=A0A0S2DLQ9_LYSEN|nr:hypothetical protein GLE_4185 [Lysobacter enzymogenes]
MPSGRNGSPAAIACSRSTPKSERLKGSKRSLSASRPAGKTRQRIPPHTPALSQRRSFSSDGP